ncbi:MAG: hypothetical protein ACPLRM_02755, partial [Anaerolineae bacterium]
MAALLAMMIAIAMGRVGSAANWIQSTGGTLNIPASANNMDQSKTWAAPAGCTITRVRFTGQTYSGDYGFLYYLSGSTWYSAATYYSGTWDTWISLPGGITQIKTRYTTNASGLLGPVDAPEVELSGPPYTPGKPQMIYDAGVPANQQRVRWDSGGNPAGTVYRVDCRRLDSNGNVVENLRVYTGTATE